MTYNIRAYQRHYHDLLKLGLPIVVGQIGTVVLGFADTFMIGHYGMKELAAASFVNTLFTLVVVFAMGFSYGLTPIVGSLFGKGETQKIGSSLKNSLLANTLMAALLLVVTMTFYAFVDRMGQPTELLSLIRPYLLVNIISLPFLCWFNAFKQFFDGITDTRTPMFVILAGNLLNIMGNYLLIYGVCGLPELGLLGAGISTMCSRIIMFAACTGIFFFHRKYRLYRGYMLQSRFDKASLRKQSVLGWPVALQLGMESASFSLAVIFVGWLGTIALAAHQVMLTISQLLYMVHSGMAAAVAVRVSYFHGQHDWGEVRSTAAAGWHLLMAFAAIVTLGVFAFRHSIGYLFTSDTEVVAQVSTLVLPMIVYQFGDTLQYTYANALRGISHVKPLMLIAFVSYFVLSLPCSYLFSMVLEWGLEGIWWAFPIGLTFAGTFYYICFVRQLRREQQP